jgi:hypothetical protein
MAFPCFRAKSSTLASPTQVSDRHKSSLSRRAGICSCIALAAQSSLPLSHYHDPWLVFETSHHLPSALSLVSLYTDQRGCCWTRATISALSEVPPQLLCNQSPVQYQLSLFAIPPRPTSINLIRHSSSRERLPCCDQTWYSKAKRPRSQAW